MAAPYGYTLLLTGTPLVFLPTMYPNAGGEVVKDLVPIASFLIWSHVIVVVPEVPAKTLPELGAYAKANPGKLVWGYGLGSTPHILGELLKHATGIDIASIPYRGGDQARADLLGGRMQMNIAPLAAMLPLIQEGKVRPLAFTGPTRSVDLPDVPTTKEGGLSDGRLRPRRLARNPRAARHAGRGGRQDQRRGRQRPEYSGGAGGVSAIGLRGEIRHASGLRSPAGRRAGEVAGAARCRGHQGAVASTTRQPR